MYRFIGMEDVVANALIELIETQHCRRVKTKQIMKYGASIIRYFMGNGEQAVLLISRDYTNEFIYNYSDFFEIINEHGVEYIALKANKTLDDLYGYFRACMPSSFLQAFLDEKSRAALLDEAV
ncbi:MAG: hypothetical protein LBB91_11380 [Clostridiales bacterium]|jgi:hypothetical protein|nr:hypothetical protein [Clostridiales bacterium]